MMLKAIDQYPQRDLTPEHTARRSGSCPHDEVAESYRYVDRVLDTADYADVHAWHGWAIREAFLAGCSHAAKTPKVGGNRQ